MLENDLKHIEKLISGVEPASISPAFKKTLRNRLVREFESSKEESYSFNPFIMKLRAHYVVLPVLAIFVATSLFAYYSPDVIPGSPLYSLKKVTEKVEGAVHFSSGKKVNYHLRIKC